MLRTRNILCSLIGISVIHSFIWIDITPYLQQLPILHNYLRNLKILITVSESDLDLFDVTKGGAEVDFDVQELKQPCVDSSLANKPMHRINQMRKENHIVFIFSITNIFVFRILEGKSMPRSLLTNY